MLLRKFSYILVLYLKVLSTSCDEGSTLAFAIDDTTSMMDDINQVKKEAVEIMNVVLAEKSSQIKNFVLVTINDPDAVLRTVTTSKSIFIQHLNKIKLYNGVYYNDCPEMSLTGIEMALLKSKPGSYIYVFTDASAKDYHKLDRIKSLCEKKQSQVVFVLTGDCGIPSSEQYMVYHKIAAASAGQVFRVRKDQVHTVLKTIKTMMSGKHSVMKWLLLPKGLHYEPIEFTIDEKADYAIVSTSGTGVELRVTETKDFYGPEPDMEKIMWNDNGKVLKIINLKPGTYYAWVRGESSTSVVIYARTDFTFNHGFSILEPASIKDTTTQPLSGTLQHLSINVTDPEHSVDIKTAQILDMKENVIREMQLKKRAGNFYITDPFVAPTQMFKIAVKGNIKSTGQPIIRISKTAIEPIIPTPPPIPETAPVHEIDGVVHKVNYGSDVTLTCKVNAHPKAKIEWFTSDGVFLPSQSSEIEYPLYISYLKLMNVRKSGSYFCKATNSKGSTTSKTEVQRGSAFVWSSPLPGDTGVYYGTERTLQCNIKSSHQMKILWFKQNKNSKSSKTAIVSNDKHITVSKAGTQLKINFMDLDMDGIYTCEASLISDPNEKVSFSTNVHVVGLAGPVITQATTVINVKNLKLICRVKGVPKPTISWKFQPKKSTVFKKISGSEEELHIFALSLKNSGVYKCTATNALGSTERDLYVEVEEPPVMNNDKTIFYGIEGDKLLLIPCNVTGYPDPVIVWKKEGKFIRKGAKYNIIGNVLYIIDPDVKLDTGDVICEAKNKKGSAEETFQIIVTDTFENPEYISNGISKHINIDETKTPNLKIKCQLVNSNTGSVRWYRNGELTKQTGATYIIEHPTPFDDGNYTCRVNTEQGPNSENYLLNVGSAPVFQNKRNSPEIIDWRSEESLDCLTNSIPEAKIKWLRNGKIQESLTDKELTNVIDWGYYTCIVSNLHGVINRSFKVFTTGCYLRNHMASQNMPLLSQVNTPSFPETISNSDIVLDKNDKIKFSCPPSTSSANNFQMIPTKTEVIAECVTEDKFIVDGKTLGYKDLHCKSQVEPSIIEAHERCSGPNTKMLRVGFPVNGFLEAYKVCYDKIKNVPLYSSAPTMSTYGTGADSRKSKWSSTLGLSGDKSTGAYTCGKSKQCCYEKSQFVNIDDLPFGSTQVAAFKDSINSVALWNPCKNSNRTSWQKMEQDIRYNSFSYATWSSWTGASNYVNKNGGLVPRYLWKVMNYDGASSAMVYVNDESPVDSDIKCSKTCESMVNESTDKYLYCCTLEEFSAAFGIPSDTFNTS